MTSDSHDVVIVGAGIAGLAAAWRLRDRDVVVLEAEDRAGGRMRSEVRGDVWLNLGGHVFKPDGPVADLARELGLGLVVSPGSFMAAAIGDRVTTAPRPELMPFLLPLSLGDRVALARIGLRMRRAHRRAERLVEAARIPGGDSLQGSDADPLWGMSFGELLGPMSPAIGSLMRVVANRMGGELDDVSAVAAAIGFVDLWGGSRPNLVGGSAALPARLAEVLGDRVSLRTRVTSVMQSGAAVDVGATGPEGESVVRARRVILAVPAPIAAGLLNGAQEDRVRALAEVRYSPFLVAGIFTSETGPQPWDRLYALAVPDRAFAMLFNPASVTPRSRRRGPGGSLVVYSVGRRASDLMARTDDEIQRAYLADLYRLFPSVRGFVAEVVLRRWPLGVPISVVGRPWLAERLRRPLGRVHFAGDYVARVGLGMDGSIQCGYDVAAEVAAAED